MSKDIIILVPNGRRVKVSCTSDTSILQLLEDVCKKQGIPPSNYNLKHHNHILDLTTTIRFCNIPNKALLEMVETEKKREESNVTIRLTLNDGERMTGDFSPNTALFDLINILAPDQLSSLHNPAIMYMRQEVVGLNALKEKSLRQLGLIKGRAVLQLLDKMEATQANVSRVYRRPQPEKQHDSPLVKRDDVDEKPKNSDPVENNQPGPSRAHDETTVLKPFDPITQIIKEKEKQKLNENTNITPMENDENDEEQFKEKVQPIHQKGPLKPMMTQESLERRLRIEEEVTFIGSKKAVAFMQPNENEDELSDLPDDFYELTIEEVRKMYHELQQRRIDLENTPMLTSTKREELEQVSISRLNNYKHAVVRIQFPDSMILQGVFTPTNTIEDVQNFVKEHLCEADKPFHIFTTPLKEILDSNTTLMDARFVPCVHMHFKWLEEKPGQAYLKKEIYSKKTTSDAASILASKYRAPSRRKFEESCSGTQKSSSTSSSSKESKVPKWFKK